MEFKFIPITEQNNQVAIALHVSPKQIGTVETVQECLNEADELSLWRPVLINEGDTPIGFAMYGLWINEGESGRVWLDRFFIDERYQGRGYASECMPQLITHIYNEYGYTTLYLSVYEDNVPAIRLYEKLGFSFNGELDINGEKVMTLAIKQLEVSFHNQSDIDDNLLRFAVIAARYNGKWVFCRNKQRETYEIPGGHREQGEGILDTARRELYEETGAIDFDIKPVCVYGVTRPDKPTSYGLLCCAEIRTLGELPAEFEIAEIILCDTMPEKLTYPQIQPYLFDKVNKQ